MPEICTNRGGHPSGHPSGRTGLGFARYQQTLSSRDWCISVFIASSSGFLREVEATEFGRADRRVLIIDGDRWGPSHLNERIKNAEGLESIDLMHFNIDTLVGNLCSPEHQACIGQRHEAHTEEMECDG